MSILGDAYDAQIKRFEGYDPRASWDYKQSSVGWGTRARAPNEVIDRAEAQRRYDEEINRAHGLVRSFAPNLGAGPTAALTSLTYNAGGDWMKSGLGRAIQSGDLDQAKTLFRQYVNAGGKPLDGLRNRREAEVGWFDAAPGQVASAGPMQSSPIPTSASGGQAPMAQSGNRSGGFLDEIVSRAANPMFQQGLGLFLASAQGKDMNQGLSEGQQRARSMQETMMKNLALQREAQQRQAVQSVMSNPQAMQGVPPALVQMAQATGDPSAVAKYIAGQGSGQTNDIKEYEYAKSRGFQGSLQDWLVSKSAKAGEYSKTPVFGTRMGPDGKPQTVMLQPGSRGDAAETALPEGVTVGSQKPIVMETATHQILLDPITRQQIGMIPKNLAEANRQKEIGTAQGKAQVQLPGNILSGMEAFSVVGRALSHPGAPSNFGLSGMIWNRPGGEAAGAQAYLEQIKGINFLEAYRGLRGGGAITEAEGQKAEAAKARLMNAQSWPEAKAALEELQGSIIRNVRAGYVQAGQKPPTAPEIIKMMQSYNPTEGMDGRGGTLMPAPAAPTGAAPPAETTGSAQSPAPVKVNSPEEAAALPSGTPFIGHDGIPRVKN